MADRTQNKTYDVLAVSSTVHKANADYLAGILRYASGRHWRHRPVRDGQFRVGICDHRQVTDEIG